MTIAVEVEVEEKALERVVMIVVVEGFVRWVLRCRRLRENEGERAILTVGHRCRCGQACVLMINHGVA